MAQKPTPNTPRDRRGPLLRGLQDHDRDLIAQTVAERSTADATTGCLIWRGRTAPSGYPLTGRASTRNYVHRLVAHAEAGFPGDIRAFPPVHHVCGQRRCVAAEHLQLVTRAHNALEAQVRNALLRRIRQLTAIVESLAPDHPDLPWIGLHGDGRPAPTRSSTTRDEKPQALIAQLSNRAAYRQRLADNQARRFRQVIQVQNLVDAGRTAPEALAEVGISRAVHQDWRARLDVWLRDHGPLRPGPVQD